MLKGTLYNHSTLIMDSLKSHVLLESQSLHSFPFGEEELETRKTGEDELALETGKDEEACLDTP